MSMSATYSPEDNKLRLYSTSRLGTEVYARVKAAGFRWAPKQDLFVAPAWTPEREDLLLELCGEIGDEDTSLVDRAEERAERFEDYSDKRGREADSAHAAVHAIADHIPLGQPILVGHHSERHARKDKERIESGMRKAVRLWETSKYWIDRAKGALRHAKYKEGPDVRARRIKGLEADLRKAQRERDRLSTTLKLWDNKGEPLTQKAAEAIANTAHDGGIIMPDGSTHWSAWSVLNDGTVTPEYVQGRKRISIPPVIAHYERWIAHYENRLAYERAMLGEAGGIVADRTKPEKGGACRCWASPGYGKGWSYIRKVNKVSVTVEDNWGNGSPDCFTRTIPFDKLTALLPAADVKKAKEEGRIHEVFGGYGFYLDQPAESRAEGRQLVHEEAVGASAADDDKDAKFEALKEAAKNGVQVVVAPQLFPTPPEIARRLVELAEIEAGQYVLEPSAGTGNIVLAITDSQPTATICAVEVNGRLCELLSKNDLRRVACTDFLCFNDGGDRFDRVVMNPPFENGSDVKHVLHALTFLKDGGRLVAVVANGHRQREALEPLSSHWIDLPPGSFKDQGTNVNTAIVVIDK